MPSFTLSSAVLLGWISSTAYAAPPVGLPQGDNLLRDRATLQAFAKTITSDPDGNITKTYGGPNVCDFAGVTCDTTPDGYEAVAGIDYNQYHIGSNLRLTGLLDKLVDLSFLHANTNDFVGTIPDVSNLQYLSEIDLSNNRLNGLFPKKIFAAPLTFLDLRFNSFSGPLPKDLFNDKDMDVLFLNDNKFTGPIPETTTANVTYVTLANNLLTGSIPASLANNVGLKEILLSGNLLTGNVPEALCALPLDVLDVSGNPQLSGALGPKCKALLKKEVLNITDTALTA
ncbi:hypothetical protein AC578_3987 [Pseudocercospora eumusae]|uniref:Leucine-rich repeat-containing N-terminal plant-type domain-containing protein n=1 Tax=Pseudocercospora eumusae TaxID=321146 RepID=A0A139HLM4_9PEZI|nr:hypothetical protein AC578_3987 [Pseudocercospora eumusae]